MTITHESDGIPVEQPHWAVEPYDPALDEAPDGIGAEVCAGTDDDTEGEVPTDG